MNYSFERYRDRALQSNPGFVNGQQSHPIQPQTEIMGNKSDPAGYAGKS